MKFAECVQKTPDELKTLLLDLRRELFNFRFRAAARDLKETARVRECRRDIARVKTALTQKHMKERKG